VVLALITFVCSDAAFREMQAHQRYQEVAKWPVTKAVITGDVVSWTSYSWSSKRNRDCPKIEYTYTAGGRNYRENNSVFDFVCWPDAYDFVAQHRTGTNLEVAYNPDDPTVTVVPDSVRTPAILGVMWWVG